MGKTIIVDMIQESQFCIDAYTARQKEKTEREDFEGGGSEDGEGKLPLNRDEDEGEERVVGNELSCSVSQVGEHAESSHLGDIEGKMGCSGTGEMRETDGEPMR